MRRFALLTILLAACSTAAGDTASDTLSAGSSGNPTSSPSTTDDPGQTQGSSTFEPDVPTTGTGTSSATNDPSPTTGTSGTTGEGVDYEQPGPLPVGNATFAIVGNGRTLRIEAWYPADESAQAAAEEGHPIEEFVPMGADRDAMLGLLGQLSEHGKIGVRRQTRSARDAPAAGLGPYPLVAFSHCHNCTRFSMFSIAEHLASHGFVVVAPDHNGNQLFDQGAELTEEFLMVRVADQMAVLDAVLDAGNQAVPEAIRGMIDASKIGAMGHSFGAATTGRLAQVDDRIVAALPIAAPVQNPLFPGTQVAEIAEPTLFVLAAEDNSIGQIGNTLLEMNFKAATKPTYIVRMKDTGHWGPSDICGLVEGFNPGCGPGTRMVDKTEFTYLDPVKARAIVAAYAAAFFDHHLRDSAAALDFLLAATPEDVVEVESRL